MKETVRPAHKLFGWALTVCCMILAVTAGISYYNARKTGIPANVLGYRAVYVLTGSMEPCMMTDSIVITKEVHSLDELKEGDIITYHVEDTDGRPLTITHRIRSIGPDGTIRTKGDNNRVEDSFPVTIDCVEAKVVLTCNWAAVLIHLWSTAKGKAILLVLAAALFFFLLSARVLLHPRNAKDLTEN